MKTNVSKFKTKYTPITAHSTIILNKQIWYLFQWNYMFEAGKMDMNT